MKNSFALPANCTLFEGIAQEDAETMLSCLDGRSVRYAPGETILREGDSAERIGVVLSGAVQISRTDYKGNRSILGMAEAGELFAEAFACARQPSMPVDVTAVEETEVLFLRAERVTHTCPHACGFHQQLASNLLFVVSAKNLMMNRRMEITSKRTTREKLLTYLYLQAKSAKSQTFTIPFDRQELADYLEVERSGLSAEIGKLRKEGIIACERNKFTIL